MAPPAPAPAAALKLRPGYDGQFGEQMPQFQGAGNRIVFGSIDLEQEPSSTFPAI